jgi:HEAT repeat protein
MRERAGVQAGQAGLRGALEDESSAVRVTAAEALALYGDERDLARARQLLVDHGDLRQHAPHTAMLALNALDRLGLERTLPVKDRIAELPAELAQMPPHTAEYTARLVEKLRSDLGLK